MGSNVPLKFGEYYLLDKIAVGGMAEIWRAKTIGMEGFERVVAIKCILPSYTQNPEFNTMFVDEARIASTLNHSNIVRITNFGIIDDKYYHEMEFVDGRNMRQLIQKCQSERINFPIDSSCYIISEILKGLHYTHMKHDPVTNQPLNIIHRDMSPQNIMISFEGEVKIIDWGIAKAKGKMEETRAGVLKGKFGYMSPEQANGDVLDKRTDIFSISTVFYETLTGERLFLADNEINTLKKIQNCNFPPPSRLEPSIDKELESIVLKGLEKDRNRRYQEALEMHEDLVRYLYKNYPSYTSSKLAKYVKDLFSSEIVQDRKRIKEIENSMPSYSWTDVRNDDKTKISSSVSQKAQKNLDFFKKNEQNKEILDKTMLTDSTSKIDSFTNLGKEEKTILTTSTNINEESKKNIKKPEATVFDINADTMNSEALESHFDEEDTNRANKNSKFLKIVLLLLIALGGFFILVLKDNTNKQNIETVEEIEKELIQKDEKIYETQEIPVQEKLPEKLQHKKASLNLLSEPTGAFVYLEGKNVGMTPVTLTNIELGKRYNITLEASGYEKVSRVFTLKKKKSSLTLKLKPISVPLPADTETLQGTGGYITLNVTPPCLIYIDGKLVAQFNSIYKLRVKPGEHEITFINKNLNIDYSLKISVGRGEHLVRDVTLR